MFSGVFDRFPTLRLAFLESGSAWVLCALERMIPLGFYLVVSAILFTIGAYGFLIKRNIITIFMPATSLSP